MARLRTAGAKLLNDDDPAELYGSSAPSITEANRRLDLAWWDFRNEAGTLGNDVYMTSSSDNGTTWTKNLRVTHRAIDRRIGPGTATPTFARRPDWCRGTGSPWPSGTTPAAATR